MALMDFVAEFDKFAPLARALDPTDPRHLPMAAELARPLLDASATLSVQMAHDESREAKRRSGRRGAMQDREMHTCASWGARVIEFHLLAVHGAVALRVDDISEKYLGLSPKGARQRAALHTLPFPTFRLSESAKAPLLVKISDLAAHIDTEHDRARTSWEHSQS